jgi:hypothetical protein
MQPDPVHAWWGPRKRPIIEQYVIRGNAKLPWPHDWVMARELIDLYQSFPIGPPVTVMFNKGKPMQLTIEEWRYGCS